MKRYFDVDFGIDYTMVARDQAHVMEILKEADGDFDENLAELGGAVIVEIPEEEAHKRMVWDDQVRCSLTTFPIGSYFSSEF